MLRGLALLQLHQGRLPLPQDQPLHTFSPLQIVLEQVRPPAVPSQVSRPPRVVQQQGRASGPNPGEGAGAWLRGWGAGGSG